MNQRGIKPSSEQYFEKFMGNQALDVLNTSRIKGRVFGRWALALTFVTGLVLAGLDAPLVFAKNQMANLSVEVPARSWKGVKLRNLPQAAVVGVTVITTGTVTIAVVDASGYAKFPKLAHPLFLGNADSQLAFSVTIPTAGDYFLVVDNQGSREARSIELNVRAARSASDASRNQSPPSTTRLRQVEDQLQAFSNRLARALVYKPVRIFVQQCDSKELFLRSSFSLGLCLEYAQWLSSNLADKPLATDTIIVSLFHEISHLLLTQWKQPPAEDEAMATELAVTLMKIFRLDGRLRGMAEQFSGQPALLKNLAQSFPEDAHRLSPEKLNNMLQWVNDPTLVSKWQPVLVPHFQTALLKQLLRRPEAWTDKPLIQQELRQRKAGNPDQSPSSDPLVF